jgi:hypothetical protein
MLTKCTVQKEKSPVKNLIGQHCAKGFNSGVKVLMVKSERMTDTGGNRGMYERIT